MTTHKFETRSGGTPVNAEAIQWVKSESNRNYKTVRHGWAYKWQGEFEAEELPIDKDDSITFNGIIKWRKFRQADTVFYFGYGEGSPEYFDHAVIKVATPLADGQ